MMKFKEKTENKAENNSTDDVPNLDMNKNLHDALESYDGNVDSASDSENSDVEKTNIYDVDKIRGSVSRMRSLLK